MVDGKKPSARPFQSWLMKGLLEASKTLPIWQIKGDDEGSPSMGELVRRPKIDIDRGTISFFNRGDDRRCCCCVWGKHPEQQVVLCVCVW